MAGPYFTKSGRSGLYCASGLVRWRFVDAVPNASHRGPASENPHKLRMPIPSRSVPLCSTRTLLIQERIDRVVSTVGEPVPVYPANRHSRGPSAALKCATNGSRIRLRSGLRRQIHVVHKQRVNARLAERDDRVGGRANDWLAVVEGRIDDKRYAGSRKETGYKLVKIRI
jgi:hypothetical protein